MTSFKNLPEELSRQFYETLWTKYGQEYRLPDWFLNQPTTPQPISRAERVQGLATIWAEARVSFPYWDRLPDLDWDAAFREYLPRVEDAEAPEEYYRLLEQFVDLLDEGHSYVVPPPWLDVQQVAPPVRLRYLEEQVVVVRGDLLPIGTVITRIDGRSIETHLADSVGPDLAGARPDRLNEACRRLLLGAKESTVELGVRYPDGTTGTEMLTRTGTFPQQPAFERQDLGQGRVLIRINTWTDEHVVDQFNEAFPDFVGVSGLIIDQRYNPGGNSDHGQRIVSRLIDGPMLYQTSHTPVYWGAMRWAELSQVMLVNPGAPLLPDQAHPRYKGPLVVLTNGSTGSAAEDFCMMVRCSGRGTLVGETTAGSSGNPAIFQLPGGGIGLVSATNITYPDGTPMIGVGVVPDIAVAPTIAGLAAGRDEVLERALDVLQA